MAYIQNDKKEAGCVFCDELTHPDGPNNLIVARGPRTFAILNRYPYTSGHLMVVPYEHAADLDGLDMATRAELIETANQSVHVLQTEYHPEGFNVGFNIGAASGAGITGHIHLHVVPRWGGDTNFMSSLSYTRVLPESLEDTYWRVRRTWEAMHKNT